MTLPVSGTITLAQVNTELGNASTANISMNQASVRSLFAVPTGAIAMTNGYGKSAAPTYATWDTVSMSGNLTSSGNTLYIYGSGGARSNIGKTSGKHYWEMVCVSQLGSIQAVGLSNASSDILTSAPGITGQLGYSFQGNLRYNNITGYAPASYTNGDVIGIAADFTAGTVTFYKNNVQTGPADFSYTGVGITGPVYALAGGNAGTGAQYLAKFGPTLTYTPPAGYSAGLF